MLSVMINSLSVNKSIEMAIHDLEKYSLCSFVSFL